jgi:hypothetical protein
MNLGMRAKLVLVVALIMGGYAMAIHTIAGELYDKGGYDEILSFQGEYAQSNALSSNNIN